MFDQNHCVLPIVRVNRECNVGTIGCIVEPGNLVAPVQVWLPRVFPPIRNPGD